jgi:hypothetical protein
MTNARKVYEAAVKAREAAQIDMAPSTTIRALKAAEEAAYERVVKVARHIRNAN